MQTAKHITCTLTFQAGHAHNRDAENLLYSATAVLLCGALILHHHCQHAALPSVHVELLCTQIIMLR